MIGHGVAETARKPATSLRHGWQGLVASDVGILALLALAVVVLHTLLNGRYGFHRDELQTFNNARHLAWGYVEYPPMTALLGRAALELFGNSLRGFRLFPAVAQALAVLVAGLAAREMGGNRKAQFVAALATAIGGHTLFIGSFASYTSYDFPCWILVAYLAIRLLKSEDPRWWVAIGAAIGLGMMTKYTMGFLALGVAGGMLLTPARRYLKSPWLWGGLALSLLVWLPNLAWQIQHHLVTLKYLESIHARDIRWGRANHFLLGQIWESANIVTVPVWCAGLWYLFATSNGKRYRMLGWMYVIPLAILLVAKGRSYYLAPAYPMLLAAGAVWAEEWRQSLSAKSAHAVWNATWHTLAVAGVAAAAITLPVAPLNSAWWRVADGVNGNFNMEIGYREMVQTVAKIRDSLPPNQRARLGILAGDDGEAGAGALYGPAYGLPSAISGMNSNWLRGYGNPPPETLIVVGMPRSFVDRNFASCELAGRLTNRYGIDNLAIHGYEDVFVCRQLREPWPIFWKHFEYYG